MITISAFADEIGPDLTLQMDTCEAHGVKHIDVRGIDGVNVSAMTLAQVGEYRKQMDDRGFAVPCIGSPIGKVKISDDMDAHLDLLKHCCDVAGAFGTHRIRVFSFYPTDGCDILDQRDEVMDRITRMLAVADANDCVLLHENEKAIYGAKPDGVKDLFATVRSERFLGIFDPANYVEEGIDPYAEGWTQGLEEVTHWFHVKDKNPSETVCVPAGRGQGQFEPIFRDLAAKDWSGFMTLEPHLAQAGQFSGFTGPELFAEAAGSLKVLLDQAGMSYQ